MWDDPWLRDDNSFFISSPRIVGLENVCLNDLFILGTRVWDMTLLHDFFTEVDRAPIIKLETLEFGISAKMTCIWCVQLINWLSILL